MEHFRTIHQFTHFYSGKTYVHLSEDVCASKTAFFLAEGLNTLDLLRFAGEYLVDSGNMENTYEVCFTRLRGITRLREYQSEYDLKDGEMKVVARYYDPYWVFCVQYEL